MLLRNWAERTDVWTKGCSLRLTESHHSFHGEKFLLFRFALFFFLGGRLQSQRADVKGRGEEWDGDA